MKTLKMILVSMRPEQWAKNLIIFAGPFFATRLIGHGLLLSVTETFIIFCLASSASYIINDVIDRESDKHHPDKSKRPIAKGILNPGIALIAAGVLLAIGISWSLVISHGLFVILGVFLLLHLAYDIVLKNIVIIDVFSIAFAFIVRLAAGISVSVPDAGVSSWMLLCTLLLALFLALCKRRSEIMLLSDNAKSHRRSLEGYSIGFLDQLITIAAASTALAYSLYALSPDAVFKHGTDNLKYTIPFVIYGIFRYLYLVHMKKGGSNPEKILIRDIPFLINVLLYCGAVYLIIYKG